MSPVAENEAELAKMANEGITQDDSSVVRSGITGEELGRLLTAAIPDKPNKLAEHLKPFMQAGPDAGVMVMLDPRSRTEGAGRLLVTNDDREAGNSALDVEFVAWSIPRQKEVVLRVPLGRMRPDQVRLSGGSYAPESMPAANNESSVQEVEMDEVSMQARIDWLKTGGVQSQQVKAAITSPVQEPDEPEDDPDGGFPTVSQKKKKVAKKE